MKKLILALLICLIPSIGLAQQCGDDQIARLNVAVVGGSVAVGDTVITLQNGLSGYDGLDDLRLDQVGSGYNNEGEHVRGYAGTDSATTRSMRELQRWNLSGIPGGSTCVSAYLYLYDTDWVNRTNNNAVNIYQVAAANIDWVEGNGGGSPQAGSSCWAYKVYNTVGWAGSAGLSTATTDYINTSLASYTFIDGAGAGFKEIQFNSDGLAALEAAFGSSINLIIIGNQALASSWTEWSSGNNATAGNRPKLVITWH